MTKASAKTAKSKTMKGAAPKAATARKTKAMLRKVTAEKAANATPPANDVSKKAHPRVAALKGAKKPAGAKPGAVAERDTAAAKSRNHALTGRSQLNFRG
ncbi:MAG: hypothetical protein IT548_18110 [Alphaproteobacteria bacterium]|nr:hypothetical protein [Alphaproteobacteria bacterium]